MCLAVPGKILEIEGDDPLFRNARVSFGGLVRKVSLSLVPEARVDDHVLVHVGVALSLVDEKEAAEVWRYLEEMGELEELGSEDGVSPSNHAKEPGPNQSGPRQDTFGAKTGTAESCS